MVHGAYTGSCRPLPAADVYVAGTRRKPESQQPSPASAVDLPLLGVLQQRRGILKTRSIGFSIGFSICF